MTSAHDRLLSVSLGWASRPEVTYPREGKKLDILYIMSEYSTDMHINLNEVYQPFEFEVERQQ